ncbi:MAG: short-chain dehydrogenase, partial [Bacteroidetes bacterium]|nr:short-chain dehydrogenase [Bacteroidota bacterium]
GLIILVFTGVLLVLEYFFIDIHAILNTLVTSFKPAIVFLVFLVSESILGLLPPEVFIAWSSKSANPWFFLIILATLSYIAGIFSYFLGRYIFLIPAIQNHIEIKIAKHMINLRKWGGLLVVIGAISPIPHSIVSLASGLIKFDFKKYLLWALFRYIRFIIYALIIFKLL